MHHNFPSLPFISYLSSNFHAPLLALSLCTLCYPSLTLFPARATTWHRNPHQKSVWAWGGFQANGCISGPFEREPREFCFGHFLCPTRVKRTLFYTLCRFSSLNLIDTLSSHQHVRPCSDIYFHNDGRINNTGDLIGHRVLRSQG